VTTCFRINKLVLISFFLGLLLLSCTRHEGIHEKNIKLVKALVDSHDELEIHDLIADSLNPAFEPIDELDYTDQDKVIWLQVQVDSHLVGKEVVLPIRHVDSIFLYSKIGEEFALVDVNGEDVNMQDRKINFGELPCLVFQVPSTTIVYVKLVSSSLYSRSFRSLQNVKIEPLEVFQSRVEKARYFHGVFFGVMFAMIIYNLFIYFIYRDYMYIVYTFFMITQTLYHLSITGFLRELILPNQPFLAKYAPFIIAGISLMSYIWFSQVYLNIKKFAPRINTLLNTLYFVITITTIGGLFYKINFANSVLLSCGLLVVAFPFIVAIIAYRKGYRQALFFLIASVLSYVGYYLFTLQRFEIIPSVFIARYSFQIMFAAQSLLFALGLGDRMNRIRKDLALGKIKQAELRREKERALKEVLEKQNVELEKKVAERTKELIEKSRIVERDKEIIQQERHKSDTLLLNILPESIAVRLKKGESMIADQFDEVSVFFSDIVGFTSLSKKCNPMI
jgi:hypothetical protein